MSQLASLLEKNAAKLAQQWAELAGTSSRLRERLPSLLRSLISALRQGDIPQTETPAIQFGFDVQGVVREYVALANLLLGTVDESGGDLDPADVRAVC